MMKKTGRILIFFIAVVMGMLSFGDAGIRNVSAATELEVGDYIYLDVRGVSWWNNDLANTKLYYNDGNNQEAMTKCGGSDFLYRVKIPSGLVSAKKIQFVRENSDGTSKWNYSEELLLSNATSNTYVLLDQKDSSGNSLGYWKSDGWIVLGETLYFVNMSEAVTSVTARFSKGNATVDSTMTETSGIYSVTIPDTVDYDTVTFLNGTQELASASLSQYNPKTANTYYYAATKKSDGTLLGGFDKKYADGALTSNSTLYFDPDDFVYDANKTVTLKVGGETKNFDSASATNKIYQYTVPSLVSSSTLFTVEYGGDTYRFYWNDTDNNLVHVSNGFARVEGNYRDNVVYFDATLSKLSYEGSLESGYTNATMPLSGSQYIYFHATAPADGSGTEQYGKMSLTSTYSNEKNEWNDVYKAYLDKAYTKIQFGNVDLRGASASQLAGAGCTGQLDIPSGDNKNKCCFYADSSDECIFLNKNREGYWDQVHKTRDAEKGKEKDVVDIDAGTFKKTSGTLYVNSTFYDYYTDFELNGNNRDAYEGEGTGASHRNWVNFRQFNQALSDYYKTNSVEIPIYTGHFQPTVENWGRQFQEIANTLNLFGYAGANDWNFFSTNNSNLNKNGEEGKYAHAAQGLVNNKLDQQGRLLVKGSDTVTEPHFDRDFLLGNNSKNTVLGEIYDNVQFPFTSQDIAGNGVTYWCFDSSKTTLSMKLDSSKNKYYLEDVGNQNQYHNLYSWGKFKSGEVSTDYGFFPFNSGSNDQKGSTYNYGFGTKLDFNFRLSEDGTVLDNNNTKVPITFEFSGDDDVWVFVDGELALDIGGDHGQVTGTLNFATGKANVTMVKKSAGYDVDTEGPVETDFVIKGNNTDQHTLTMYYMERGMWESNMKIQFNFSDDNEFLVEKEVVTDDVNTLFANFKTTIATRTFTFNVKNQATHYGTWAETNQTLTGFIIPQDRIKDYGSVAGKQLKDADGAIYTKTSKTDTTGTSLSVSGGKFTLSNGETATFNNQFRRGSYIYLEEQLAENDKNLFATTWELYEKDEKISNTTVPGDAIKAQGGAAVGSDKVTGKGTNVSDGRIEVYNPPGTPDGDAYNNSGYTTTGPAALGSGTTTDTLVFRSYSDPDDDTLGLNIKVKEINTVKTGGLKITKAKADGSKNLNASYTFKVVFSNIGGLGGTDTVTQEYTLKAGETQKIDGIPVGTKYVITEDGTKITDGSELAEIDITGNDDAIKDLTKNEVTGTIVYDAKEDDYTTVTFKNMLHASYTVEYYTETDKTSGDGVIKVGDKYYELQKDETVNNSTTVGTNVKYAAEENSTTTAGVTENSIPKKTDKNTYQSFDGFEFTEDATKTHGKYEIMSVTDGGENLVRLFYDKVVTPDPVQYTVKYYTETDKTTGDGVVKVGDKYYELQSKQTVTNDTTAGTKITYAQDTENPTTTAGVKEGDTPKKTNNNTYKSFDGFVFTKDATLANQKSEVVATKDGENLVELFYDKASDSVTYTVKYYTETDKTTGDGVVKVGDKYYELQSKQTVTNDTTEGTKITYARDEENSTTTAGVKEGNTPKKTNNNTYKSFEGFVFTDSATLANKKSEVVATKGGENLVELFYDKETSTKAPYKTEYYVKKDGSDEYELKETVQGSDTEIGTDVTAVVKDYPGYDCVKTKDTVERAEVKPDGSTTLRLYYDPTEKNPEEPTYQEKYWVEITKDMIDDLPDGTIIRTVEITEKNGTTTKANIALVESTPPQEAKSGDPVDVHDKQAEITSKYQNHELVEVEIPGFPTSDTVADDGTTTVHQVYVLKPTYTIEYYVQIDPSDIPPGANPADYPVVDGKTYMLQTTIADGNYVDSDTPVQVTLDQAGVLEGGTLKADSDKKFENYTYSTTSTTTAAATEGRVNRGEDVVLKLFYDFETTEQPTPTTRTTTTATYTVQYYIQQSDGTYKLYTEYTNMPGTAGSTATATIFTIEGYDHVVISDSNESAEIKPDNSTVLKVYYKLKTATTTEKKTTEKKTTEKKTTEKKTTEKKTTETKATDKKTTKSAKTGDDSPIDAAAGLLVTSAILGAVFLFLRRRKENR